MNMKNEIRQLRKRLKGQVSEQSEVVRTFVCEYKALLNSSNFKV